jgi:membrane protein YqaA with SNARE-associated domain
MDILQAYLLLFNDCFLTSLIVVPRLPYVIDVMTSLGNYNNYLILLVSFLASVMGLIVNWIIGLFFRKLENYEKFANRVDVLKKAEKFFATKGKWILLLSAIPFWGALFTTAAGVLRLSLLQFIILVSFSKFIALAIQIFF